MWQAFPTSEYYGPADFLKTISTSFAFLGLFVDTPPWRIFKISHVYVQTLQPCRALRPR